MPVTREQWRQLYAAFNPSQRLELDDTALFVERPGAVAEKIAGRLAASLQADGKWVVCGSMGTGKSSELVHLGGLLQHSHAVVGLDLPNSVAQIDRIQPAEVLFLIGVAAVHAARELWGHTIDREAERQLSAALRPLLSSGTFELQPDKVIEGVALFAAQVVAPGVSAAVGAAARAAGGVMKSRLPVRRPSPLGGLTRTIHDGEPDLVRLQEAVDRILAEVANYRPPIVLVDGLDKISELPAIRGLFSKSRILALPRAPVVYTAPITLMLDTEWQAAGSLFKRERLTNLVARRPALAFVEVSEAKLAAGQAALREVVARRLNLVGLRVDEVFEEAALALLTATCGGVLRDLIHLVNYAVELAFTADAPRIDQRLADEAVSELRKEYEITMDGQRREELAYVRKHGEPSSKGDVALKLLLGGYVLPYSNGRVWFEPHPILRDRTPTP
jgi:energy-coupling factor transporter ATP-binding protein EcfA2